MIELLKVFEDRDPEDVATLYIIIIIRFWGDWTEYSVFD